MCTAWWQPIERIGRAWLVLRPLLLLLQSREAVLVGDWKSVDVFTM